MNDDYICNNLNTLIWPLGQTLIIYLNKTQQASFDIFQATVDPR